jgi:prepilin-type N-terminal cleavage/methylation domain-containing protein
MRGNSGRRAGFTLVELLVVMVLLGVVVGGLIRVIAGQQRFYRSAGDLMDSRSQIRQAVTILPADLRGVSGAGGDLLNATDISMRLMANIASSAICSATANSFTVPPLVLASGQAISVGRTRAAVDDIMMVYDEGATSGRSDDLWQRYRITRVTPTVGACVAPFTQAADLLRESFVIDVTPAVSATIPQGAPVRFLREVHYELYRASDNKWYLGYAECPNSVCGALQPVSGPYLDYSSADHPDNGVRFQFFNSNNVELTAGQLQGVGNQPNRNWVARTQITVRGQTANAVAVPGLPAAPKRDELVIQVGLRNRQ